MTSKEFCKKFFKCEKENNFFSYTVKKNFQIWDYLRYPSFYTLFSKLSTANGEKCSAITKVKKLVRFTIEFYYLFPLFLKVLFCPKKDIVIYSYDRDDMMRGNWVNITCYPIAEILSAQYKVVFFDPSLLNEKTKKLYPCPVFRTRPLATAYFLLSRFVLFNKEEKKILLTLQHALEKEFVTTFKVIPFAKLWFCKQFIDYNIYKFIFKRLKPKMVFHSDIGTNKGWIQAAHEQGVQVIDCQHSLMSEANILYQYPSLKNWIPTFSDKIFTFGPYWHDKYNLPVPRKAIGYPYMEIKKEELKEKQRITKKENSLIVINSNRLFSGKKLAEVAVDLARKRPDLKIYFKLRSDEYKIWREVYTELANLKNITIIDNHEVHLYEYFLKCNYQLGVNSTALVEGMVFGVQTFVLKADWYEEMEGFLESKNARLVENASDILRFISSQERFSLGSIVQALFLENSAANLLVETSQIVKAAQHYHCTASH